MRKKIGKAVSLLLLLAFAVLGLVIDTNTVKTDDMNFSDINSDFDYLSYQFNPPSNNTVISTRKTTIVPGVVESEIVYNNSSGSNPVSGFIVDINLGSSVNIMASSNNYNQPGTQTVRGMAQAAESATGRNIIAAINADLNWSGTGLSNGPLIIDGNIYTDNPAAFFGIRNNGQAVIGDANLFTEIKDDLYQAVRGMGWLVRDGEVVSSSTSVAPRTAVGLKADGTVFFYVVEGRMFPRSVGISLKDLAEIMLAYGAVQALNMDGGGSTTYLAKMEGKTSLELRSVPSDGFERPSISSLLVYADVGDGVFNHAAITAEGDVYTPESQVEFTARGVDSAGGFAALPENLTWKVTDSQYGSINQDGIFTSNGTEGLVAVYLEDESGRKVGEGFVEIRVPDEMSFRSDEYSFGFDEVSDFGLRLLYQQREVTFKEGDILWFFDDELGTISDNIFRSNANESVNGVITAMVKDTEIVKDISVIIGKLPLVIFDFENDEINDKWVPSSVNGPQSSLSIVHRDSGEPVRFGNQALRIDFDFTTQTRNPGGAYAGFTDREGLEELGVTFELPGSPVGVGMWIYATEEAQGLWLRTGIGVEGTTAWRAFNLTEELIGIDWIGWKYVEVTLNDFVGPYTILPGQFIRLMITANSFGGVPLRPTGSVYVDDITVTYGTNIDDVHAPIIDSILANDMKLSNVTSIDTNNITIEASFREFENQYASGIDYENVSIFVDGINYLNQPGYALDITDGKVYLQNIYLRDGVHEIKVVVIDNAGNEQVDRRYIVVNTNTTNSTYLEELDPAVIGKDFILELKSEDINEIDAIDLSLLVSRNLHDFTIEFHEAFEGDFEFLNGVQLLNIIANRVLDVEAEYIFRLSFAIDSDLNENAQVGYSINIGAITYKDDTNEYLDSFSMVPRILNVVAPLSITSDLIFVNREAVFYVTDYNGNYVENAEVFLVTSPGQRESLGFTNEFGALYTDIFMIEPTRFNLVAEKGEDISFAYIGQSFDSQGEEDGTPFLIKANGTADSHSSQNIVWLSSALSSNKNTFIQYALKSEFDMFGYSVMIEVEGSSNVYAFAGSSIVANNYAVNINSVSINDLLSGKEYVYRVGNGDAWSEIRSFNKHYEYSDVNFVILGDVQTERYEDFDYYFNRIALDGKQYDFMIQVGDFIEDAGTFSHWFEIISTIENSVSGHLDIIHVLGNHEYYGDPNADIAKAIFDLPNKDELFYSVEYGLVYVGVINYSMQREQVITTLEEMVIDANQSNARWKILVTHQSPYYTNPQGGNEIFHELLPQYAEQAGIDFVFSGHDHAYARTKPILNGSVNPDGVVYVVTGAIGEKRYTTVNNPEFHFDYVNNTFKSIYLSIEATYSSFTITTIELEDGSFVDSYTKNKDVEHEHAYLLVEDRLICVECSHNRSTSGFTGLVRNYDGDVYFLYNGSKYFGYLWIDHKMYYFDLATGQAFRGSISIWNLDVVFSADGYFVSGGTGFALIDENTYYYDNFWRFVSGWREIEGETYYFSTMDGRMRTGRTVVGGIVYDFAEDGKLIGEVETGFIEALDGIYYLDDQGRKVYGWREIEGETYYFSMLDGYMKTSETEIDGILYQFTTDGKLIGEVQTGFISLSEGTYYLDLQGRKLLGWREIEGETYYFSTMDGRMRTGRTVVGGIVYDFAEDGKLIGEVETGFIEALGGIYYLDDQGRKVYGWREIEGETYYFSMLDGYMKTSETEIDGILYQFTTDGKLIGEVQTGFIEALDGIYYLDDQGRKVYGWREIEGETYYFSMLDGYMKTSETEIDGILYQFTTDGKLIGEVQTGFISLSEGTYYLDLQGRKLLGWREIEGETYYFSTMDGRMRTGRTVVGGIVYDFAEDGKLIGEVETGFIEALDGIYYLDDQGRKVYGWREIEGETYYFSMLDGYMKTSETEIDGILYQFTTDGKLIGEVQTGFISLSEGTYYLDLQGRKLLGWREIEGETYYFSTMDGRMRTGRTVVGGIVYDFAEDGKLIGEVETGFIEALDGIYYLDDQGRKVYGWREIEGETYYFSMLDGYMKTSETEIDGVLYQFTTDGKLIGEVQTGFISLSEGTYYLDLQGRKLLGWREIEGETYYFSTMDGRMRTGRTVVGGIVYDFAEDGKLIGEVETGFIEALGGIYYLDDQGRKVYGWREIEGETYYFSMLDGYMKTSETEIDGILYQFTTDGKLIGEVQTGFISLSEGTYYLDLQGRKLLGWREIEGETYYFSTMDGRMRTGRTVVGGIVYDFAEDGKLIGETETS